MPTWRCPHCGTPQAETARCWVCRRSSTACGTCRHFRRSVAAQLGYCGLDRRRAPLVGDEIRACWESLPAAVAANPIRQASPPAAAAAAEGHAARREFIEVGASRGTDKPTGATPPAVRAARTAAAEPAARGDGSVAPAAAPGSRAAARPGTPSDGLIPSDAAPPPMEPRWNLWGDLEI